MTNVRRKEQMKLGAFFHPTGNHVAAWLHPDAQADAAMNFQHYVQIIQKLEAAKFDLLFLQDSVAMRSGKLNVLKRWPQYIVRFEPLTLLSALAAITGHIGLVATATTSYNEPYHIARKFASLDHLSGGRAGWNVVTSSELSEALNFGRESHYDHSDRYARAREFTEVVFGLWDSWDDDAFIRDRNAAVYFDPEKLHTLNHKGKYFVVRGPLNVARPPQGYPVIAQAGASEAGKELAAETAEIVFCAQQTLKSAQAFYQDVKERMAKFGRSPENLKIMPGLNPIVGHTRQEAADKHQQLQSLVHPDVGLEMLSSELGGIDLAGYPIDGPLPEDIVPKDSQGSKSTLAYVVAMAREEKLTIRQLYLRYCGARGQRTIVGTAQDVADEMEEWFVNSGVDGFLVQPAYLPGGLNDFVDLVIPELQRRGLFRTEYSGHTLRENLGLPRPSSRYQRNGVPDVPS